MVCMASKYTIRYDTIYFRSPTIRYDTIYFSPLCDDTIRYDIFFVQGPDDKIRCDIIFTPSDTIRCDLRAAAAPTIGGSLAERRAGSCMGGRRAGKRRADCPGINLQELQCQAIEILAVRYDTIRYISFDIFLNILGQARYDKIRYFLLAHDTIRYDMFSMLLYTIR